MGSCRGRWAQRAVKTPIAPSTCAKQTYAHTHVRCLRGCFAPMDFCARTTGKVRVATLHHKLTTVVVPPRRAEVVRGGRSQ